MKRAFVIALAISLATLAVAGLTPERSKGISMHLLPKGVADLGGEKIPLFMVRASQLPNGWKRYDQ